jgi:hypothetical protein
MHSQAGEAMSLRIAANIAPNERFLAFVAASA